MSARKRHAAIFALATSLLLTLWISATPAQAADYTMKYAVVTVGDTQHFYGNALNERLEKATNGKLEVKVFPRGQLGSPSATIQGLQLGTIEAAMFPIDFFAGVDPRAGVFSIPFMFKSRLQANRVLEDKKLFDEIMSLFEAKGIVGLMVVTTADGKYIARDPIRKLSDFEGKKLRVNATDAERERMKRLGASAVPMGLGEMITSLKSGAIDGTMSGISIHVNFNLQDISKTLLQTQDTMLVCFAGVSKKWLDSLPKDLAATILKQARSMQPVAFKLANEEDATLTEKWLKRGGEIIHLSDADLAEMHKRIDSVGTDVTAKNPDLHAFYQRVKALSDKTE